MSPSTACACGLTSLTSLQEFLSKVHTVHIYTRTLYYLKKSEVCLHFSSKYPSLFG